MRLSPLLCSDCGSRREADGRARVRRFRDLIAMKSQHTLGIHFAILDRLREEEQKAPEYQDPEYLHVLRRVRQQSDERLFFVAREYTRVLVRASSSSCSPRDEADASAIARVWSGRHLLGCYHGRVQLDLAQFVGGDAGG